MLLEGITLSYVTYHHEIPYWLQRTKQAILQSIAFRTVALNHTILLKTFLSYSIYGGFVRWQMGEKEDGSDSIAIQVADENVRLCFMMLQFCWVADLSHDAEASLLFVN